MPTGIRIRLFEGGRCVHPGFVVKPGSGLSLRQFPAGVGLLEHPKHGYVLFDTGYHEHFFSATRSFPERFYAWTTPCKFQHQDGIVAKLAELGLSTEDINHVVLSHFHADHIAAVSEFTNSQLHCSEKGLLTLKQAGRFGGVRKGYLPALVPESLKQQFTFHDSFPMSLGDIHPDFKGVDLWAKDLFQDKSVYLVNLPGHAAGQVGLLAKLSERWVFLLADACWLTESLSENIDQHWLANILCDSVTTYRATLTQLRKAYRQAQSTTDFVPAHCEETITSLSAKGWLM